MLIFPRFEELRCFSTAAASMMNEISFLLQAVLTPRHNIGSMMTFS
jgi:hypothetical protein